MDNFKAKTFTGVKWNFLGQAGGQVLAIFFSIALAREIAPAYFGMMAMVNVVVGFSSIFINLGFGAAIIQREDRDDQLLSSIFWLNIIVGSALSGMLFLCSDLLARFYEQSNLSFIAKCLSPIFILSAFGNIPRTILAKAVEFKYISLINLVSITVGGTISLFIAFKGFSIEALIAHLLIQALILNISIFLVCKWKPDFVFAIPDIKKIMKFSMNVLGNDIFNYWVRNIDTMLIGKYIGSFSLGIYNKSYSLLTIPVFNISGAISQVLFPSLSTIKKDKQRVRSVYLRVVSSIGVLVFPAMIGVFVTADKVVLSVLGDSWIEAIDLIRIFCFLAMIQSISSLVTNIYLSQGRPDIMFKVGTVLRIMLISSIVLGLIWGINGVAICYTIAGFISALINNYYAGRLINLRLIHFAKALAWPFFISIAMGLLAFLLDFLFLVEFSILVRLVIQIVFASIIYLLLSEIVKSDGYIYLKNTLLKKSI